MAVALLGSTALAQEYREQALVERHSDQGSEVAAEARAQNYLVELQQASGAPGISAAVAAQGRFVFSEGVGNADLEHLVPAGPKTVYNIGSVSKAISAVAVMQLVERRGVGLDDPIQRYVPSFPDKGTPITLRQRLTHTSGIRHYRPTDFPDESDFNLNWRPYASVKEAIGIFRDDPLLFTPGSGYAYTSYGINLLQGVVEAASGSSFGDYLEQQIFAPAGMQQSGLDIPSRIVRHRARGSVKGFNACLVIYLDEQLIVATAGNADRLGFAPALVLADLFRGDPTVVDQDNL